MLTCKAGQGQRRVMNASQRKSKKVSGDLNKMRKQVTGRSEQRDPRENRSEKKHLGVRMTGTYTRIIKEATLMVRW